MNSGNGEEKADIIDIDFVRQGLFETVPGNRFSKQRKRKKNPPFLDLDWSSLREIEYRRHELRSE